MDDEVVMVAHQAVSQHLGIKPLHALADYMEQRIAIFVVFKDRFSAVATRGDVIQSAGELDSQWSGHRRILGSCERSVAPKLGDHRMVEESAGGKRQDLTPKLCKAPKTAAALVR